MSNLSDLQNACPDVEEYVIRTPEEIEAIAEQLGVHTIWPSDQELVLDVDLGETQSSKNVRVLGLLMSYNLVDGSEYSSLHTTSRNGGQHIYHRLTRPITPLEAALFQACMGSDPLKEALTALGNKTCMFETSEGARQVQQWRAKYVQS